MPSKAPAHANEQILKAIKAATEAVLAKQREHRQTLKAIMERPATPEDIQRIEQLGLDTVFAMMEGECWVPSSQDWLEIGGLQWDETPRHRQLAQISDEDIRHALFFHLQFEDQARRLQAAARFYQIVGAANDEINEVFALWAAMQVRKQVLVGSHT